ncbi:MAG TPA: glycosyltransferase [Candidatus Saccharimonadales bacterium]|nr:glycosyltransferase [Candidatus Saccharimonadales bacterium]
MLQRKNSSSVKLLSIIVPAYKQEKTIIKDVKNIQKELRTLHCPYEIIVVVDGHADKTYEQIKSYRSTKVKILTHDKNEGKGQAIRYGMLHAKGDIVGFIDAGMELNPKGLAILWNDFINKKADIVIGSKRHPLSKVSYPLKRKIISHISQKFIRLLFGLNVTDTQVGIKFFRKAVIKKVLPHLLVKKFAFDVEILTVAYYFGFKKIYEAPIELKYNFQGSVLSQNMLKALYYTLWDTCAVFYRLKIIHYYDKKRSVRVKSRPDYSLHV